MNSVKDTRQIVYYLTHSKDMDGWLSGYLVQKFIQGSHFISKHTNPILYPYDYSDYESLFGVNGNYQEVFEHDSILCFIDCTLPFKKLADDMRIDLVDWFKHFTFIDHHHNAHLDFKTIGQSKLFNEFFEKADFHYDTTSASKLLYSLLTDRLMTKIAMARFNPNKFCLYQDLILGGELTELDYELTYVTLKNSFKQIHQQLSPTFEVGVNTVDLYDTWAWKRFGLIYPVSVNQSINDDIKYIKNDESFQRLSVYQQNIFIQKKFNESFDEIFDEYFVSSHDTQNIIFDSKERLLNIPDDIRDRIIVCNYELKYPLVPNKKVKVLLFQQHNNEHLSADIQEEIKRLCIDWNVYPAFMIGVSVKDENQALSFRQLFGDLDLSTYANKNFGGGGHHDAAGGSISLDESIFDYGFEYCLSFDNGNTDEERIYQGATVSKVLHDWYKLSQAAMEGKLRFLPVDSTYPTITKVTGKLPKIVVNGTFTTPYSEEDIEELIKNVSRGTGISEKDFGKEENKSNEKNETSDNEETK